MDSRPEYHAVFRCGYSSFIHFERFCISFDVNSTEWKIFVDAYKVACRELTKLDGSPNANTADNLNKAVAALRRVYFDVNYDGINPNLYIIGTDTNGDYAITATYNNDDSITFNGTVKDSNDFGVTPFSPVQANILTPIPSPAAATPSP